MKTKKFAALFLIIAVGLTLTGCFGVSNTFRHIRIALSDNLDCRFNKEFEFSVGPAGLMFASVFVNFADTDFNLDEMLDNVSGVQVGIYKPIDFDSDELSFSFFNEITPSLESNGWKNLVKTINGNELTGVFVKSDEENRPGCILVISFSGNELVLAEISGDLEKLVKTIMENEKFNFNITSR